MEVAGKGRPLLFLFNEMVGTLSQFDTYYNKIFSNILVLFKCLARFR